MNISTIHPRVWDYDKMDNGDDDVDDDDDEDRCLDLQDPINVATNSLYDSRSLQQLRFSGFWCH
jgi:hypothetical protein